MTISTPFLGVRSTRISYVVHISTRIMQNAYTFIFASESRSVGFVLITFSHTYIHTYVRTYRGADKSLVRPGRKQATAREDFDFHISYL